MCVCVCVCACAHVNLVQSQSWDEEYSSCHSKSLWNCSVNLVILSGRLLCELLSVFFLFYNSVMVSCSVVSDSLSPWTVAHQDPLSMEFSSQEYWSGLPFPLPGDLPDPGIKSESPALQADFITTELPGKPILFCNSWR